MPTSPRLALAAAILVVVYAALVLALVLCGRRADARAIARFVPDALVLCRRLLGDSRVRRRHKLLLAATLGYLAMPVDLVPDFIPVAGQADDVIVVALVVRAVLAGAGRGLLEQHWPGPQRSLQLLARLVDGRSAPRA